LFQYSDPDFILHELQLLLVLFSSLCWTTRSFSYLFLFSVPWWILPDFSF
jgi:hypothetical protein